MERPDRGRGLPISGDDETNFEASLPGNGRLGADSAPRLAQVEIAVLEVGWSESTNDYPNLVFAYDGLAVVSESDEDDNVASGVILGPVSQYRWYSRTLATTDSSTTRVPRRPNP